MKDYSTFSHFVAVCVYMGIYNSDLHLPFSQMHDALDQMSQRAMITTFPILLVRTWPRSSSLPERFCRGGIFRPINLYRKNNILWRSYVLFYCNEGPKFEAACRLFIYLFNWNSKGLWRAGPLASTLVRLCRFRAPGCENNGKRFFCNSTLWYSLLIILERIIWKHESSVLVHFLQSVHDFWGLLWEMR